MVREMIGNIKACRGKNEEIILGTEHPMFGFIPTIIFADWDKFREFITNLTEYYDENCPKIPDVYLRAFEEEERKC